MAKFDDSLRGYAYNIHKRDSFKCQYCGADGLKSFETWLTLSWDHLLPKGHPDRDNPEYIVTACQFCNTADNRYFDKAETLGLKFEGLSREKLIAQRLPYVLKVRQAYREFWESQVVNSVSE
jgi:5-methylcytosine-specific restriction endonuclease McrA